MKKCNKCEATKSLAEFFKDKNNKTDGHYSICKTCKQTGAMNWRAENKSRYNENMRKYHKKNYQKFRLQRYDLTLEQYTGMLKNQNGLCGICCEPPKANKPLVVDHDHTTNEVRGLLCYKCNRDMVPIDDKSHLEKLLAYRDKKHEK